jgi:Host cell surface-exposed lipoprotein
LKFEGYKAKDAEFAVDAIDVNWNQQAARVAKGYLDYQSFSRSSLIDQLEFEGFTPEQAEYGVQKAY